MKLSQEDQVMNLMNTNGRRSDVINAYTIYMEILSDLYNESGEIKFDSFPNSLNQFMFYEEAIKRSPETFKLHTPYDFVAGKLLSTDFHDAFLKKDILKISTLPEGKLFLEKLDNGVEDRARHYTSNLVKIGFVDNSRKITPIGKSFVEGIPLKRGSFEALLPIDDTNLIFLRQLLKLRVYNKSETRYYSPMKLCMYILTQNEKVKLHDLRYAISMIHPSHYIDPKILAQGINLRNIEEFEKDYIQYNPENNSNLSELELPMDFSSFKNIFKNRKSVDSIDSYYRFYSVLVTFLQNQSSDKLGELFSVYAEEKDKIQKAFSFGLDTFFFDKDQPYDVDLFFENNNSSPFLNLESLNVNLYEQFSISKRHDSIKEYSDTLMRLLSVTGIISMKNGVATLKYRDLWCAFYEDSRLSETIFMDSTPSDYKDYENNPDSPFLNHITVEEISELEDIEVLNVVSFAKDQFNVQTPEQVKSILVSKVNDEFIEFINNNYQRETVVQLLDLFSDRNNDTEIQNRMNSSASVPTLFEYIVGLAWYHISDNKYDVFSSFNLTMNADFIPETHAGGGDGDIIARYEDKVVMLEATLMNKRAQKRGEWEPVLRHATNLTISEYPKDVWTLFIADELDDNTINIWRAIANVPLKSSREVIDGGDYVQNVTVMPLKNAEISTILINDVSEELLLSSIKESYSKVNNDFDLDWRKKVLDNII
ncbi:AlwI family type II restriction endonuclease [Anaerorhabdus sp.]|uniref:AlwI family type II restriction endonuclease n=1 Tax=Anaerorhabdus sp. TaxID=1872524 RepID=UPI002B21A810|nr:AlwI family type II restriction endonuclease [Anaerorhabdus sp.]MEA4875659.1 AlwI family type II restriction endonuclease [Anaerorhabdus sp.]